MEQLRVDQLIKSAAKRLSNSGLGENAPLEAEMLLSWVLDINREQLYLKPDRILNPGENTRFERAVSARCKRQPLQYITNRQYFCDLELIVNDSVLIPRPETELLVEEAIKQLNKIENVFIIEFGTGSGNIAISLAKHLSARIYAIDISGSAIAMARQNAVNNRVEEKITFIQGDMDEPIKKTMVQGKVDAIISNPPYIPTQDIASLMPEVRDYEPQVALDGGQDGLDIVRRLIDISAVYLKPGGWLGFEIGMGQSQAVNEFLKTKPFHDIRFIKDFAGIDRIVSCKKN